MLHERIIPINHAVFVKMHFSTALPIGLYLENIFIYLAKDT